MKNYPQDAGASVQNKNKCGSDVDSAAAPFLQGLGVDEKPYVDCACTKIEQDEHCPVGYPSLLCDECDGKGVVPSPRAQALEDTGNPVNYDHAEAMQVLAKCACKGCGGTGERNDADCGDMYFNTWVCDVCDGQGWDRQAYFEAFPSIRALSSQPVADRLPQDVINLVIAAREAWETWQLPEEEFKRLDAALEAFASRVRYENEPDALPASPGASE